MVMENISVIVAVYNEEKRIDRFLSSFSGFGEIIVVNKSSTDNTEAICQKKRARVVTIPYTDRGDIYKYGVNAAKNNWLLLVTASDIIHPELKKQLIRIINSKTGIDLVYVPYMMYNLGINSKHSVFDIDYRPWLGKKEVVQIRDRVHEENGFNGKKPFKMKKNRIIAIHHLTHQTLESVYERHFRYTREELKKGNSLYRCLRNMFSILFVGIKKRFWKIGWDGLALLLVLLDYHIMVFLRYWIGNRNIEHDYEGIVSKMAQKADREDFDK
jgi:glycosyltransferase involved in cell wall biosynthesis